MTITEYWCQDCKCFSPEECSCYDLKELIAIKIDAVYFNYAGVYLPDQLPEEMAEKIIEEVLDEKHLS